MLLNKKKLKKRKDNVYSPPIRNSGLHSYIHMCGLTWFMTIKCGKCLHANTLNLHDEQDKYYTY